jgi:MFS family permease
VDGDFAIDVLPSMILLGVGAGTAFNPVLLAAMSDVEPTEAGLASGLVNTSFMMGGALGLAVLASLAASRTDALVADGEGQIEALTGGYNLAFLIAAIFALAAAVLAATSLRACARERDRAAGEPAPCSSFAVADRRAAEQAA